MKVLLVSTYEMGHQPLGLAAPAAALRARGHDVTCLDLAVESPEAPSIHEAGLVGIAVPMHTAARLGVALARRVRRLNPAAHIAFYGLYASPLYDVLTAGGAADSVIGGEYEPGLVALAAALERGVARPRPAGAGPLPLFQRQRYPVPDRRGLPHLEDYARLQRGDELRLAAYVEATRGCAHTCRHCPLTPVYGGRLRLVQAETVLADVEQQVALGASHVTFGDPDFFNAVPHSLAILREMHGRHPEITFDATIKVEHLVEHASLLPELAALGCVFITSAFESTDDAVLAVLAKGHSRADLDAALRLVEAAGITLRPTWLPFSPWTTADSFLDLLDFVETRGLVNNVQPVQYALRLLLPPGSPLIEIIETQGRLGPFDDEGLTFTWTNADRRLDALQRDLARLVEAATATDPPEPIETTFLRVKQAALAALRGDTRPASLAPQPRRTVPGLTEAWFC